MLKFKPSHLFLAALALTGAGPEARFPGEPGTDPWTRRPNDPEYAATWQYFSHIPYNQVVQVPDAEAVLGAGMHVDRAWQLHTGTPATKIAVLDSGILWDTPDLRERFALNTGELPLPHGSDTYDANGDGRVEPSDWSRDPRCADAASKGHLTPADLIAVFSDGNDSDGNGFVDDIAGWDFLERDNDPADRTEFGHGTMEGNMSAGAVNNGIESAGACGNCSVAFLRVNDSFMADSNSIAAAIEYAVDNGFSVVQAALGPFNMTPALRKAVEHAWSKNVIVVATAADENSFHNNQPAVLDQVLYVNALRFDGKVPLESSSYLAFNNCSNFGARLDVSASGKACSSEATARLAGIVALAKSFADTTRRAVSVGEMIATVRHTADDIDLGPSGHADGRMPSHEGWDSTTGNGRVNAASLLRAIASDQVFPGGRIVSPEWFDVFSAGAGPFDGGVTVPVDVAVPLARTGAMRLRLKLQRGVEAEDAEIAEIAASPLLTGDYTERFAVVDLAAFVPLRPSPHEDARYRDAWTLILEIDDLSGRVSQVRRTFFQVATGGPTIKTPGRSSIESSPLFYDLDLDGADELIFADGAGLVHVVSSAGKVTGSGRVSSKSFNRFPVGMPGSRLSRGHRASIFAPLAAGEIEPGKRAIVAVSLEGDVMAIDSRGNSLPGFPVSLPFASFSEVRRGADPSWGFLASPVMADIDHDGRLEIIQTGLDGHVYAIRSDGSVQPGFPVPVRHNGTLAKIVSSPAVHDINGDGILDLVFGTAHWSEASGFVFAISGRGTLDAAPVITGFPAKIPLLKNNILPLIGSGIATAPAIADIDGDGVAEIVAHGFAGKAYVVGLNGRLKRSLSMTPSASSPAIDEEEMTVAFGQAGLADIDGDGVAEVFAPGSGRRILLSLLMGGRRIPYHHLVGGWSGVSGAMIQGFPRFIADTPIMGSPIFADVTGDGRAEVIFGDAGFELHAFDVDAAADVNSSPEANGFPKRTGGWTFGSPAAGDFDGDGRVDLAAVTREGFVFVWPTRGRIPESARHGFHFKGNTQRTGVWLPPRRKG